MRTSAAFLLLLGTCIAGTATGGDAPGAPEHQTAAAPQIGGPFSLVDQTGHRVSDADFRGRYMLVFFGFTHCPDVCPATMTQVSETMKQLGDRAAQVQPILISVDPLRDNPSTMTEFLGAFDGRIIGLTGTREELEKVAASYLAFVRAPQEVRGARGHQAHTQVIDHSAVKYLMGPDGKYVTHFSRRDGSEEMAPAISKQLEKAPGSS